MSARRVSALQECGPLEEKGVVMGVLDKAFDVLVLSLGVVKRVYCNVSVGSTREKHFDILRNCADLVMFCSGGFFSATASGDS